MEYKTVHTHVKEIEGRSVPGIAAVIGNIDLGGDRIHKGAFTKTLREGRDRIKHLWQHNYDQPPTAVITELKEIGLKDLPDTILEQDGSVTGGLLVVREYLDTPKGDEILEGIRKGAITQMSFAYDPIKFDYEEGDDEKGLVRNLRELRLWETSDVVWGMNPLTSAAKSAILYKDTGVANDDAEWTIPGLSDFVAAEWDELQKAERDRIASHFAMADIIPPERFEDLKLAHHAAGYVDIGPVVWNGLTAAMNELFGVTIPDSKLPMVYTHLAKHYKQFDREAPPYKFVVFMRSASKLDGALLEDLQGDQLLEPSTFSKVKEMIAVLQEIFESAEPRSEQDEKDIEATIEETQNVDSALTERVMQRLQKAKEESKTILNK